MKKHHIPPRPGISVLRPLNTARLNTSPHWISYVRFAGQVVFFKFVSWNCLHVGSSSRKESPRTAAKEHTRFLRLHRLRLFPSTASVCSEHQPTRHGQRYALHVLCCNHWSIPYTASRKISVPQTQENTVFEMIAHGPLRWMLWKTFKSHERL